MDYHEKKDINLLPDLLSQYPIQSKWEENNRLVFTLSKNRQNTLVWQQQREKGFQLKTAYFETDIQAKEDDKEVK